MLRTYRVLSNPDFAKSLNFSEDSHVRTEQLIDIAYHETVKLHDSIMEDFAKANAELDGVLAWLRMYTKKRAAFYG
jgi:hypothetical protein